MFGMGLGGGLIMILFWVGLIVGAVWLAQALFNSGRTSSSTGRDLTAKEILDQRFARGEITREEYDLMKQDLQ
ncbi:MAG TPA: SHOCT domain-containing protein [Anaerolineae bacterium]|nr:SHOCT domain-containing protein [Anaerolineae bacterium]